MGNNLATPDFLRFLKQMYSFSIYDKLVAGTVEKIEVRLCVESFSFFFFWNITSKNLPIR